jgi:hypothetical protein
MATPRELLGGPMLTKMIQLTPSGLPPVLPPEFFKTRPNVTNVINYWYTSPVARMARIIRLGDPPVGIDRTGLIQRFAVALHSGHFMDFDPTKLQNLLAPDGTKEKTFGEFEIKRQAELHKQYHTNLRYAAAQMALFTGKVGFNKDGKLLPYASYSTATYGMDFEYPASHLSQIALGGANGTTDIFSTAWDTTTTNIVAQMSNFLDIVPRHSPLPIGMAIYGKNILQYLAKNDTIKALFLGNNSLQNQFVDRRIPDGFLGIPKWIAGGTSFYTDEITGPTAGVWPKLQTLGDSQILFCPDVSDQWWEFVECSDVIPKELGGVGTDALAMLGSLEQAYGMAMYGKVKDEPITVRTISVDNFCPIVTNPNCVFRATVA